ncbi:MAG: Tn3 family transposase [Chloroflexi bacterium]|nr:hypothetical protein [Chloroflexota bacterium]NOG64364.1 Tn3 family transposase [Chloroflexota bacterium]
MTRERPSGGIGLVDSKGRKSGGSEYAAGSSPRIPDLNCHLYTVILAQARNIDFQQMVDVGNLSYHHLSWANNWYLPEETLPSSDHPLGQFPICPTPQSLLGRWAFFFFRRITFCRASAHPKCCHAALGLSGIRLTVIGRKSHRSRVLGTDATGCVPPTWRDLRGWYP